MKKYYVSIDFEDTKPITYQDIVYMAFDSKTENEYADYLQYVLKQAKRLTATVGQEVTDVDFGIHETGCIVPFGCGSFHPYSKNFYTEMWLRLPDNIQKAR
jgi:hypothetical protein